MRVKDKGLLTTVVLETAAGVSAEEIAKKTGMHPETIRRYKRSAEYKAFEGRYLDKVDQVIGMAYKVLTKALDCEAKRPTPAMAKIALALWNGIVPKTVGGAVKQSEEDTKELSDASLDEIRMLMGREELTLDGTVDQSVVQADATAESTSVKGSKEEETV